MSSLAKNLKALTAALGIAAAGLATGAQAQTACGLYGIGGGTQPTVVYDPFNPSGLASTNVVMNVTRVNPAGGGKTDIINFFLKASGGTGSDANGIQIIPLSVTGQGSMEGQGLNVFHDNPVNTPPMMLPAEISPSSASRFVKLVYNGNAGSADTLVVTFQVIMPANLNLDASTTLAFDAEYKCKMSGGTYNKETHGGTTGDALVFPVKILSALRASYVGTALDFGEISQQTAGHRTNVGNVRVQSSGAYGVTVTSQNGYKLERPGAATGNDRVGYKIDFLGDTRSPSATSLIDKTCIRAGMATEGKLLPIRAELVEAGAGKNPSPTYTDYLTVTVTPLAYNTTATTYCENYALPQ